MHRARAARPRPRSPGAARSQGHLADLFVLDIILVLIMGAAVKRGALAPRLWVCWPARPLLSWYWRGFSSQANPQHVSDGLELIGVVPCPSGNSPREARTPMTKTVDKGMCYAED